MFCQCLVTAESKESAAVVLHYCEGNSVMEGRLQIR